MHSAINKSLINNGLELKNIPIYIIGVILIIMISSLASLALQIIVERVTPVSSYIKYNSMQTEFAEYATSTPYIKVISDYVIGRDNVVVKWRDELHCKNGDSWDRLGGQNYPAVRNKINSGIAVWRMSVKLPDYPATCRIYANTVVELKHTQKTFNIYTPEFKVVNELY